MPILFIAKFIARIFGIDITKAQRIVIIAGGIGALVLVIFFIVQIKSCLTKEPQLDEAEIQKAQQAIEQKNNKQLRQILEQSDNRVAEIEQSVNQAEANTKKAVKNYDNMNTSQLAEEIEKRK